MRAATELPVHAQAGADGGNDGQYRLTAILQHAALEGAIALCAPDHFSKC